VPIEPTPEQLEELAKAPDRPIVMLNLNRYRDRAEYDHYTDVALKVLDRLGGRVLWYTRADQTVIGDESDEYDEVIAVQYPSPAAFLEFVAAPEIVAVLPHRRAALERAAIIRCDQPPLSL
jgi:uncharacterized protein (DUF1330 family)